MRRALVESLYRHDREELVDGPTVWQTLEEREVAEILVGKQFVESSQFFRDVFHVLCQIVNLMAYTPVHGFYLGSCLEVDDAMREEFQSLVAYLLSVVPVFEHIAWVQVVPDIIQVFYQLVVFFLGLKLLGHLWQRGCLEYIDDEY